MCYHMCAPEVATIGDRTNQKVAGCPQLDIPSGQALRQNTHDGTRRPLAPPRASRPRTILKFKVAAAAPTGNSVSYARRQPQQPE